MSRRAWVSQVVCALLCAGLPAPSAASANGFLYIENSGASSVTRLATGADGTLSSPFTTTVPQLGTIAATPDGRTLFVGAGHLISAFAIGADGSLTLIGNASSSGVPVGTRSVVAPDGRHLYVPDQNNGVDVLSIAPSGALTDQGFAPGPAHGNQVVVTPDGKLLIDAAYQLTAPRGGTIVTYAIGTGGALTATGYGLDNSDLGGMDPIAEALSPDGRYLYVANKDQTDGNGGTAGTITAFSVSATGELIEVGVPVPAVTEPLAMAISPNGKNLYVTGNSGLSVFATGDNGSVTPLGNVSSGPLAYQPVVSSDGQRVYVSNYSGASVSAFAIGSGGVPAPLGAAVATNTGGNPFFMVAVGAAQATVAGLVRDRDNNPAAGIKLTLTGKTDGGADITLTTTSDAGGSYSFKADPGNYSVTAGGDPKDQLGGSLTPANCDGTPSPNTCALPHVTGGTQYTASFTYTFCGAARELPDGQHPTGCPIIFIPGILGSIITCPTQQLWPNFPSADFADMRLKFDGINNEGAPGSCNAQATTLPDEAGVVRSVAGLDAYGSALDFINQIAPGRAYAYPYDWRKSVDRAMAGLDTRIDAILAQTGAEQVVLWAHSMGGLVARDYIDNSDRAKKVARFVSVGTPYWGAPKSFFALLEGDTDTPAGGSLDLAVTRSELQEASRNFVGLFWLYPSANLGGWLSVNGGGTLNQARTDTVVNSLGGTSTLLDQALAGHARIDGFRPNGVQYEAVVGTGVPTVQKIEIADSLQAESVAGLRFDSGDGTVPLASQTQGASNRVGTPPIPLHYVCGVKHADETGNGAVEQGIKDFLLTGGAITGLDDDCPYSGTFYEMYFLRLHVNSARVTAAGASMTLTQARQKGLIDLITTGDTTSVVTDDRTPVSLTIAAKGATLTAQTISSKGAGKVAAYGPLKGTVTLSGAARVASKGKALKPAKPDTKAPRTTATVSRHAKRYSVKLKARDAGSGVAATYVKLGTAATKRYTKPLNLTAKQLKTLRFDSVDRFGNAETPRKAKP